MHRYSTLFITIALGAIFNCPVHAQNAWTDSSASWHTLDGGFRPGCNCGQPFGGGEFGQDQVFSFEGATVFHESQYNAFAAPTYYPPVVTHYASQSSQPRTSAKSNEPTGPARHRNPRGKRHAADFAAITYIPGPFDEAPAANAVALSIEEQPAAIAATRNPIAEPSQAPVLAEPRAIDDHADTRPTDSVATTDRDNHRTLPVAARGSVENSDPVVATPAPTPEPMLAPEPASVPEPEPSTYVQDQYDVDVDQTDEQPLDELLGVTDVEPPAKDVDEVAVQEPEVEVLDYANLDSNSAEPESTVTLAENNSLTGDASAESYEPQIDEVVPNDDYTASDDLATTDEVVAQAADDQEASSDIDSTVADVDTDYSSQDTDASSEPEFAANEDSTQADPVDEDVDAGIDVLALTDADAPQDQVTEEVPATDVASADNDGNETAAIDPQTQEQAVEEDTGSSFALWMFAAAPLALVPAAWLALRRKKGTSRAQHFIAATSTPSDPQSVPGTKFYPKHEAGQPASAQAHSTNNTTQSFSAGPNPQQAANAQKAKNLYETLSQAQGAAQPASAAAPQQAQATGTDTTVPPSVQPQTQAADPGSLSRIQGIDDTTTTLLRLIGINNVADLAAADPERIQALMNVQGISQEGISPRHWIEQARGIMQTS